MDNCLERIEKIRSFNRFYTQVLGLLNRKLHESEYSLSEARVLFEVGQHPGIFAKDLSKQLTLDPAYLSRILASFHKQGLITKEKSTHDTRKQIILLSPAGESELKKLQKMSSSHLVSILSGLNERKQIRLIEAMNDIESILGHGEEELSPYVIRTHQPGDIGYITHRHAVFFAEKYGFDATFEAYVASALVKFVEEYNFQKERLWIIEEANVFIGSIAIVKVDDETAQLRWFLVEPHARGKGLGKKLLSEAINFSRLKEYKKIILWTVDNLDVARELYSRFGFNWAETKSHLIWGQDLTEELWELNLE